MLNANQPVGRSAFKGVSSVPSLSQNAQTIDNIKLRNQMRRQNKAMISGNANTLASSVDASGMKRPNKPIAKTPVVRNRSARDYH